MEINVYIRGEGIRLISSHQTHLYLLHALHHQVLASIIPFNKRNGEKQTRWFHDKQCFYAYEMYRTLKVLYKNFLIQIKHHVEISSRDISLFLSSGGKKCIHAHVCACVYVCMCLGIYTYTVHSCHIISWYIHWLIQVDKKGRTNYKSLPYTQCTAHLTAGVLPNCSLTSTSPALLAHIVYVCNQAHLMFSWVLYKLCTQVSKLGTWSECTSSIGCLPLYTHTHTWTMEWLTWCRMNGKWVCSLQGNCISHIWRLFCPTNEWP